MSECYYVPGARAKKRDYNRPPTAQELTHDLNTAHDNIKKLVKEKDELRHAYHWQRIWVRILTAAIVGQWAIIIAFIQYCIRHR